MTGMNCVDADIQHRFRMTCCLAYRFLRRPVVMARRTPLAVCSMASSAIQADNLARSVQSSALNERHLFFAVCIPGLLLTQVSNLVETLESNIAATNRKIRPGIIGMMRPMTPTTTQTTANTANTTFLCKPVRLRRLRSVISITRSVM